MKHILNRLINHETISAKEAKQILINISKGDYNQSQIASFLTVFMMRSVALEELKGFRNALLELCIPVDLSAYNPIDLCGTGGDGKDTFNISTLSSFVTAPPTAVPPTSLIFPPPTATTSGRRRLRRRHSAACHSAQ